jgi:hypothetical protein
MGEKANSDVTRDTMPGESAKSSKTRIAPRLTVLKIELIPSWPRRFLALLAI